MLNKEIQQKMKNYSPFFQKVWTACAEIPEGEVRTYGWLAKKIGHPKAARAVGTALGANPFAPTVPCHRVIRSDKGMGGYSGAGGIKTKIKLLKKEGAI
jgi:O-6-methylguanine DNA methyltransferase